MVKVRPTSNSNKEAICTNTSLKQTPTTTRNVSTLDYNGEFQFFNSLLDDILYSIPVKKYKYVVSDDILVQIASLLEFDVGRPFATNARERLIRNKIIAGSIQAGHYKSFNLQLQVMYYDIFRMN